jgi:hypothetical protein
MKISDADKCIVAVLLWAALATTCYHVFVFTPKKEAYEAATRAATPEALSALLARWKRTTYENGAAMHWDGRTSTVLWTEYMPAWKVPVPFGGVAEQEWIVWARSKGGRYYKVAFGMNKQLNLQLLWGPMEISEATLVEALVNRGRADLIEQLDLPRKGA